MRRSATTRLVQRSREAAGLEQVRYECTAACRRRAGVFHGMAAAACPATAPAHGFYLDCRTHGGEGQKCTPASLLAGQSCWVYWVGRHRTCVVCVLAWPRSPSHHPDGCLLPHSHSAPARDTPGTRFGASERGKGGIKKLRSDQAGVLELHQMESRSTQKKHDHPGAIQLVMPD